MTIEIILTIYFSISAIFLFTNALLAMNGDLPNEIDNFYDWVFYGLFWIFIVIKYMIKFIYKLFKA